MSTCVCVQARIKYGKNQMEAEEGESAALQFVLPPPVIVIAEHLQITFMELMWVCACKRRQINAAFVHRHAPMEDGHQAV